MRIIYTYNNKTVNHYGDETCNGCEIPEHNLRRPNNDKTDVYEKPLIIRLWHYIYFSFMDSPILLIMAGEKQPRVTSKAKTIVLFFFIIAKNECRNTPKMFTSGVTRVFSSHKMISYSLL